MDEQRKYAILFAAMILAARKLEWLVGRKLPRIDIRTTVRRARVLVGQRSCTLPILTDHRVSRCLSQ